MLGYVDGVDTDREDLVPVVERLGPRAMEGMMAMEGKLVVESEARGEVRGEIKGRADALLEILAGRFGSLSDRILEAVRSADAAQLQKWTSRVLSARTPDEVVGL